LRHGGRVLNAAVDAHEPRGRRHWRSGPRVCRSRVRRRHHRDDEAGEHW